ncbi:hypothetical protein PVT67_11170 [Gallaecimonas kandeliae]|uniref:hypothetical protein n=1 Tax=Gallaecimonas kandeliae TaxID=3029055 RepID=UPI0026491249|nr:hypothetical protein [Gallaecimonas kandeliae]WKE64251.1 hypothetical protein PVT67_11170 [Gallaecimonas kandeliae]
MTIRSLCLIAGLSLVATAHAGQPPILKNDPKRPVAAISRDLGVSVAQFVGCFAKVNPTPGGARPESMARVHANKAVLLPCLQQANPKITNEMLDAVMDRYRPGGRKAQEPVR